MNTLPFTIRDASSKEIAFVGSVRASAKRPVVGLNANGRAIVSCSNVAVALANPKVTFVYHLGAYKPLLKVTRKMGVGRCENSRCIDE